MVRKNKLLIGCLTLLLVLSVGYALFSETITINGTATAKGSFDITTTCTPGYSDELLKIIEEPYDKEGGFENSICYVDGNKVMMTTDLLYPKAARSCTVKMTNTGTIPALIWGSEKEYVIDSLEA